MLDVDRDGSITSMDFEILANKLASLIGQDDVQRRDDYANARKTLCEEIMRADTNHDGRVTLGMPSTGNTRQSVDRSSVVFVDEWLEFHRQLANELRKADTNPAVLEQVSRRINTTFHMLDLNHDGHIARDEWMKTCQFFGVDEQTADQSFRQISDNDRLEEDQAKQLFVQYLQSNDPNHVSNCCLCFL
jgi:hypothetical protein